MEQVVLQGRKGGESEAHQPVEQQNNLLSKSYAKVLLAVGEGEFAGVPTGKDIFLDGTPLISPTGFSNFGGVTWEFRPGTIDQAHIVGMPDVSSEYNIGFALTSDTPYTRLLTEPQLDAFRVTLSWPALYQQKDNGDIVGYNIVYAIDVATDGGPFVEQGQWDTNTGKTTVEYNRTHRINLPKPGTSWTIRVRRQTPNQNNIKFQDSMQVKTIAEVIDAKLRYPNTALLYVEFDAELFGGTSIPKISLKTKGRYVQVPSNYDSNLRVYTGIWDGTFKWAWSNNPAWVFYDLVINERFGLGSRITPDMVDKWTLYQVAQYCDVPVPDGNGGMEPRYTCNIYIQARKEAWQVLRDIVAVFNGMLFWSGTQMVASADMPVAVNAVRNYSRANVVDGKFSYGSTSEKTIYTTALVSFDDPDNHYETAVEAVNDLALVQRYKTWAQSEITAIGVTSRGQAQRKGKYTMLTNSLNRLVTFKLGLEGYLPRPGDVIGIADQILAGANFAGRISNATLRTVRTDRVPNAVAGDILYINKADGTTGEGRTILSVVDDLITVTADYTAIPSVDLTWYVEKNTLKTQLYRVTKVTWSDDAGQYEVQGVQYEDSKYAAVDSGARLESRPITTIPAGGQDGPTGLTVSSFSYIEQTLAVTTLSVKWDAAPGAMNYEAQWRKDGGDWVNVGLTASTGFDVKGIYSGAYQARVRAINAIGVKSVWVESDNTQLTGKVGEPPAVATFTASPIVFGIKLDWTFPEDSTDTLRTEIEYGLTQDLTTIMKLGDFAYPVNTHTMMGLKSAQQFFFRARLVDRSGNIGPWSAFISGMSSNDASEILDYLTDQITHSQLGQELLSEIGQIGGSGPGSVNERLDDVKNQLQTQIDDANASIGETKQDLLDSIDATHTQLTAIQAELQAQIDSIADLADSMPYKAAQTYSTGQGVLGADGKIYQAVKAVPVSTPPPNAEFWMDVGQAVVTAAGLAARVSTVETKVTDIEGVNTAQATQISGLQTSLTNKADASALQSLTTRVTSAEGSITSQGTAITNLTNTVNNKADASALTALTTRVSTAEGSITSQGNAITSLNNTVAGKADSSTVSALSNTVTQQGTTLTSQGNAITTINSNIGNIGGQNLLYNPSFDVVMATNALIPDGWIYAIPTGPTWAASVITSAMDPGGKAVRLDVSGMTTSTYVDTTPTAPMRPPVAPGQIITLSAYVRGTPGLGFQLFMQHRNAAGTVLATASQGVNLLTADWQRITLTSAALPDGTVNTSPLLRVRPNSTGSIAAGFIEMDRAQLEIGAQVSGWRDNGEVTDANVAANASATSALTSRVTQTENTLTSQSSQITDLNASVTNAGASGVNLLPAEMSVFSATPPVTNLPSAVTTEADAATLRGYALKMTSAAASSLTTTLAPNLTAAGCNMSFKAQKYIVSYWARANVAGHQIASYLRVLLADGVTFTTGPATLVTLTDTWARYSIVMDVSNATTYSGNQCQLSIQFNRPAVAGRIVWFDRIMVEPVRNGATEPSTFVTGNSFDQSTANATATTALTARVTQTESSITSQSSQITSLTANLATSGSQNLVYNPSFEEVGSNKVADGWVFDFAGGARTYSAPVSTLDPGGVSQRVDMTGISATIWHRLIQLPAKVIKVVAGQVYTASAYVKATAGLQIKIQVNGSTSANVGTESPQTVLAPATGDWQRLQVTFTVGSATTQLQCAMVVYGTASLTSGFMEVDRYQLETGSIVTGWRDNGLSAAADVSANADATTALTARVTSAEGNITSVSGQVTSLSNSLGGVGGDNMLPNSSFETLAANGVPTSWQLGSSASATPTLTMVDSPLSLSTSAVRLTRAALANGGYIDLNLSATDKPKVTPGLSYTLSTYARLSSPSARFASYIQWMNDAGTVLSTIQVPETVVGTTFTRLSVTGVAPAGAVKVNIYAGRLLNRSGVAADMWIEIDNVQLQEGAVMTAYSPSVQAASNAIDSLNSTVTQQGTNITSLTSRTTSLENTVNSATDGLATKASSSALQTLTNRVTAVEGVNTSQATAITDLNSAVSTIQGSLGASGLDPAQDAVWNFDTDVTGWTWANGSFVWQAGGFGRITATTGNPVIASPGINVNGALYPLVRARITRRAGAATDWNGNCYYATSSHGISSSYRKQVANPNIAIGQSAIVEWDMSALTVGGTDWTSSTIAQVRFDLGNTTGGAFDVDWIAVGRVGPAASSRAMASLNTIVTQQGTTLTSQASQITNLNTVVGNQGAALQTQSSAIADSAGKIAATYSVKLQLANNGLKYVAGFGVSLDNSSGVTQSQFVVAADRFAIIRDVAGNVTSPFVIDNGQAYIDSAVIRQATIMNLLVSADINSSLTNAQGLPVIQVITRTAQIITRHLNRANTYTMMDTNGITVVVDGVLRVRMGVW